jgi:hypothetical protein
MVYTRRYTSLVPLPRDEQSAELLGSQWPVDVSLFIWLVREGFERRATADALEIIEFNDLGEIAPEDVNPKADEQLGHPAAEFIWRSFEAIAQRPAWSYWLEAESLWREGQQVIGNA